MSRLCRAAVFVAANLLAAAVFGDEVSTPKAAPANPGFEKLKSLAGTWVMAAPPVEKNAEGQVAQSECDTGDAKSAAAQPAAGGVAKATAAKEHEHEHGDAPKPGADAQPPDAAATLVYKVIAAGSAVHEHMFPGTPHEMVTMYHCDGPDLMLTHYCAAGNQPRMKAEKSADPNQLVFHFAGGTNLNPAKDMHMHDVTITFIDAYHIRQEWTHYKDGKLSGTVTIELKRVKD